MTTNNIEKTHPSDTRQELSNTLMRIVSSGRVLSSIKITELVANAKMSRSNFYNYFDDIYDLLQWTYHHELEEPMMHMYKFGMHREGMRLAYKKIHANRTFYMHIYRNDNEHSIDKYMEKVYFKLLSDNENYGNRNSGGSRWYGTNISYRYAANAMAFVLKEWLESDFTISIDDIMDFSVFARHTSVHEIYKGHKR